MAKAARCSVIVLGLMSATDCRLATSRAEHGPMELVADPGSRGFDQLRARLECW